MTPKLAIYNRYWNTLGGGEKYLGELAVGLSKFFDISLISTDDQFTLDKLSQRLGINNENIKLLTLSNSDEMSISYLSSKYDVFINGTYNSKLLNRSPKGVLVVFFPMKMPYPQEIKRPGFYRLGKYVPDVGYCGRRIEGDVTYILKGLKPYSSGVAIKILRGLPKIENITYDNSNIDFKIKGNYLMIPLSSINQNTTEIKICFKKDFSGIFEDGIFIYDNKGIGGRIIDLDPWGYHSSYETLLADSLYARKYIKQWWNREEGVDILYPPIESFSSSKKEKVIIAVGRFFRGSHNKKQEYLIEAFKRLIKITPGWSLHLVGGVSDNPDHINYVESLKQLSVNLPVHFHVNAPRELLIDLYAKATMLWHGTGYKENEILAPEKMEHFGITPIEAMSAGCIPLVFNGGGPREYIMHGDNGFLWNNLDQLIEYTKQVATNYEYATKLGYQAFDYYKKFSMDTFYSKTNQIAAKLLEG